MGVFLNFASPSMYGNLPQTAEAETAAEPAPSLMQRYSAQPPLNRFVICFTGAATLRQFVPSSWAPLLAGGVCALKLLGDLVGSNTDAQASTTPAVAPLLQPTAPPPALRSTQQDQLTVFKAAHSGL
jgi:hypothetical protein